MNIIGTQFSLPTHSYEIYVAGCKPPHCPECHNPESWDFDPSGGTDAFDDTLWNNIMNDCSCSMAQRIWILGGEPLDQDHEELKELLKRIRELPSIQETWLFTGYEIADVPVDLYPYLDYIKTGRYEKGRPKQTNLRHLPTKIELASDNQLIWEKTDKGLWNCLTLPVGQMRLFKPDV